MARIRPASLAALTTLCLCLPWVGLGLCSPSSAMGANGGCANTNATPNSGNLERIRAAVLCLINSERERAGETALRLNVRLQTAAQSHSEDMSNEDYFEHVGPRGDTPLDRMRASGYVYSASVGYEVGENIAWGTLGLSTPRQTVAAWMASPGHRANILDAHFRDTAIGVSAHPPASLAHGQPGAIYTQDFGVIVTGRASRYHATPPALYNLRRSTTKRRHKGYGSTRRKVRHRHRLSARHRSRHRRAAGRAGRTGAHKRPRRRRR